MALALVVSAVAGFSLRAGAQPPSRDASLTVNVKGLPAGLEAHIAITGPDGYDTHSAVHHSHTISGLVAGHYTVGASSVKDSGGAYWPATSNGAETWQTTVDVSTAGNAVVDVDYSDYVKRDVRVVPDGATQSLRPEGRDEDLNILRSAAPETYQAGEILVSAPTPVAPNGYVLKVDNVEKAPDPTLETLSVDTASLEEAVPEADMDEHENLAAFNKPYESRYVSCTTGGGITVSAQLHVTPSFTLKATWGRRKHRSAEFDAQLKEQVSSQLHSESHLNCDLKEVPLGPRFPLAPHGFVLFFIGPVPVAIKATIGADAEGGVHLSGGLTAYTQQKGSLGVHLSVGGENQPPKEDIEPLKGSFTQGVTGSLEVAVVPDIRLKLYGIAGPGVGVRLSAKLHVGDADAGLELCAQLEAHLHILRFPKVDLPRTSAKCRKLLHLTSN